MADINSDQILEVPDTPDRIQQSTCPVSSSVVRRDVTMAAANPVPCRRIRIKTRNSSMHGSSSQDNACSVLPAPSDTDHIFKQAEVARILALSENLEAKFSLQKSVRTEMSVENEKRAEKSGLDQTSSISDYISCSVTGGRSPGCGVRDRAVSEQDGNHRNVSFLGVGSGLHTIPVGKPRNRTCTSTTNRLKGVAGADISLGSSSGEVKGEVVTNKAIAGPSSPPCGFPQRHVGQKKLVRNGCISPSNIAKRSVKADEKQEICSRSGHLHHPHPQLDGNVIDLTDNSPIMTRQRYAVKDKLISRYNMDTRAAKKLRTDRAGKSLIPQSVYHGNSSNCSEVGLSGRNNKGKEISSDILDIDQIGEGNLRRVSLSAAGTSSVVNNNSSNMDAEQGWRTTHNHMSKLPISLMGKLSCSSEQESGSSAPSSQDHGSGATIMDSNKVGNKTIMIGRARREHTSMGMLSCSSERESGSSAPSSQVHGSGATIMASDRVGNKTIMVSRRWRKHASISSHPGESSSACVEPGASFVSSSKITTGRNHTSHRLDLPVITIDDIPPEARPSSSGYSNGTTSADPTIQAQLESDELLARQLQEQLYNESPRFAPTEEIDAIVAMSLQHEEDTHRTSRPVRRFPNNTRGARASRLSAFRAELATANSMLSRLRNTAPITLGLGAIARYPAASHIQPNIDLNDYDALLALDENNHQHTGASESQINNLPQSVVQSNSIEEPCAVCLENPSVGDTIRHLPCFHKFHKECIDEWLRRKKLCPICKSGIR